MTGAAASVGASESAKRSGNGAGQGTSAAVRARAAFPLPDTAAATALAGAAAGCLPKRSVRPLVAAALVGAGCLAPSKRWYQFWPKSASVGVVATEAMEKFLSGATQPSEGAMEAILVPEAASVTMRRA